MIVRKITACTLLFIFLLIGAAALDRYISQVHYSKHLQTPRSPNYNINTINVKETDAGVLPFGPREYIRIIRRPTD